MCCCHHTRLTIFLLGTEGQVSTLVRVSHYPSKGDPRKPSIHLTHCRLAGEGARWEEVKRDVYVNLHWRSYEPANGNNCGLALRKKRTKNNAFALFKHCGLNPFSSQQMKDSNAPQSPGLPCDALLPMHPPHTLKKSRQLTEDTSVWHL